MGIDTSAKVFLGLPADELPDGVPGEGSDEGDSTSFQQWCDDKGVDRCSPYFDAPDEACLFGFDVVESGRYQPSSFPWEQAKVDELTTKFKALFGKDPMLYISPHVT